MANEVRKKIVFQDGSEYYGYGFGADSERVCEIVFDTAMAGYFLTVALPDRYIAKCRAFDATITIVEH